MDETMHANSFRLLRPSHTAPGHSEETTLICFQRTKAQRQRRAMLDRERLGRWPYTPDSDNAGDGVNSQWAGEEALSFSPCTSCISSEERVMSPIRFPHGSAKPMGQMSDGRHYWDRCWGKSSTLSPLTTCPSLSLLFLSFYTSSWKPEIESHWATKWEAALFLHNTSNLIPLIWSLRRKSNIEVDNE